MDASIKMERQFSLYTLFVSIVLAFLHGGLGLAIVVEALLWNNPSFAADRLRACTLSTAVREHNLETRFEVLVCANRVRTIPDVY